MLIFSGNYRGTVLTEYGGVTRDYDSAIGVQISNLYQYSHNGSEGSKNYDCTGLYSSSYGTIYSNSGTKLNTITSSSASAYPTNGYQSGNWYVKV